jgi:U3 small nucleolar RNA-associated protein 15
MAVHCTRWGATTNHVLSASDDKSVRLWDISTGEGLATLHGHTDYVRCAESMLGAASAGLGGVGAASNSGHVWATGSYDHTVRLWDMRESDTHSQRGKQVMSMDHGAPVEAVLPLTGGTLVLSAGDNRVRVWDVMGGGRLIAEFSNHQKTVTALACDREGSRVLTGGLDGMIKVHDMKTFNNTASMRYGSPILSFGLTPGNRRLVVGLSTGALSVKTRSAVDEINSNVAAGKRGMMNEKTLPLGAGAGIKRQSVAKPIYSGSIRYFARGHQIKTPAAGDLAPAHQKKQKLNAYDGHMKKFRYGAALDAALDSKQPGMMK